MNSLFRNRQFSYLMRKMRPFLVAIIVLFLLIGAVVSILDALNVIALSNAWINAIGIFLAALGVLAAFGQWLSPGSTLLPTVDQKREPFRQQVERDLNKRLKKGALVVFTTEDKVGHEFHLISQRLWKYASSRKNKLDPDRKEIVKRHRFGAGYICAVIYRDLDPDDYMVWTDVNQTRSVPVFSNEVARVDQL